MNIPAMDVPTYIRARAEQLALQADPETFTQVYLARAIAFRTDGAETATAAYDALVAPHRVRATDEIKSALEAAQAAAEAAYVRVMEARLTELTNGAHDALDGLTDEEKATVLAVEAELFGTAQ